MVSSPSAHPVKLLMTILKVYQPYLCTEVRCVYYIVKKWETDIMEWADISLENSMKSEDLRSSSRE
jgi:hypothetical protein